MKLIISLAVLLLSLGASSGDDLKLQKSLPIAGDGRWDYVTVDPTSHLLYVPRSTHVQVVDPSTGKVQADWADTSGVHGVAIVPSKHLAFTSNGKTDNVSVIDLQSNKKLADVKAGTGPDAIVYDDASNKILCMNHRGGTVTLITVGEKNDEFATKEVTIGGALEAAAMDGAGHAFVNVEDKNEVVEVDTREGAVMKRWPIKDGEEPTGIAIDVKKHRLFVGCGGNGKLVVLDSESGAQLATLPIGAHCDGVAFDPATGEAFAACGDGTVAVARETEAGKFEITQTIQTKPGARTIAIDESTHQLYLLTADSEPAEKGQRPKMKAGTFQILVVGR